MAFWARMKLAAVMIVAMVAATATAGAAENAPLPLDEKSWVRKTFDEEGGGAKAECSFAFETDAKQGNCLAVGPWRAGQWYARLDYGKRLPSVRGTLRGFYRTEKVPPYGAVIWTWFYKGEKRLNNRAHCLAPAADWTPFEVVVRVPTPGADAMSPSVGLTAQGEGRLLVAGLTFSPAVTPQDFPAEFPKVTRPAPPKDFKKGEFIRLEQRDGTWWLVTPAGEGFYSAGVDGPEFPRGAEGLKQGRALTEALRGMGFNSLAGWTNPWRWGPLNDALAREGAGALPAFRGVGVAPDGKVCDPLIDARGHGTGSGMHTFPDPFDPRFEPAFRAAVREGMENIKGKPWFAAWFPGGELSHENIHRHVWSKGCAEEFGKFLRKRYPEIKDLNAAWKTDFASFDELLAKKPDPAVRGSAMGADFQAFAREIVRRYIETTLRVIHEEDPGHLVFSQKFMLGDTADWIPFLDLYAAYDGIALDMYPANQAPGLDESERAIIKLIHEKTGKPIVIGEWSVPAVDSGLYDDAAKLDWSWAEVVETQGQRARQTACVTTEFYNLPCVVGAHWFIWGDIDSPERKANRGLFKAGGQHGAQTGGEPWKELQDALGKANRATAGR